MAVDSEMHTGERPLASAASGCLYATYVVSVSGGMLLLNAIFCLTVFSAIPKQGNAELVNRVGQLFYFIVPIVMLVIEWNLLDRIQRLFRSDS